MTERRDFGRMALEMRESLDQYSREELADLLTHIVRVYVIEGSQGVSVEAPPSPGMDRLKQLSFAQLMLHLQMNMPHEELRKFQVSGQSVWIEDNGREIHLTATEPAQELPPDADMIAPEMVTPPSPRAVTPVAQPMAAAPPAPPSEPWGSRDEAPRQAPADPWETRGTSAPRQAPSEPWGSRDTAPRQAPAPAPVGLPRQRRQAPSGPGVTAQDAGRVQRPSVGLRDQSATQARLPSSNQSPQNPPPRRVQNPWAEELRDDSPKSGNEKSTEEIGDVSGRFSMLELD